MRSSAVLLGVPEMGSARQALGGMEGGMEAALDAPSRIEPSINPDGTTSYGPREKGDGLGTRGADGRR